MNRTQVNAAVAAVLQQIIVDHTSYPLVVEQANKDVVDQSTQVNPYLRVKVIMLTADQLDLADHPWVEKWGQIWLTAVCKPGEGTANVTALLDFVIPYFELKRIGGLNCQAVPSIGGKEASGLWCEPAIVNFYFQQST